LTRGDPPKSPELKAVWILGNIATLYAPKFHEATREENRVVKHKHLYIYFDRSRIRRNDRIILEALATIEMNELLTNDDASIFVLGIMGERGLGFHTLFRLMLWRWLVSSWEGKWVGDTSAIDRIYRRAGTMIELYFDIIDTPFFREMIDGFLKSIKKLDVKVSVLHLNIDEETGEYGSLVIRMTSTSRWRKYRDKPAYTDCIDTLTLKEAMEFKDWSPKNVIPVNYKLTKYFA